MQFGSLSIAALLCLTAGRQCPAQTAEQLTLEAAIAMALQHNRLVRSSAIEVSKFADRLAAMRTRRFPQFSWYTLGAQRLTALDFRFEQGAFGVYPNIGPIPDKDTSIRAPLKLSALLIGQISQPVSQQYKIGLGLRQLELTRESALQSERAQRQNTVSDVKHAYYSILQAQSALDAAEETIRLYRELDRLTDQYVIQQVALKSDNMDVKARLAKAEYDALTIRNPLATQKERLNSLLGRDLQTEFRAVPVEEASWTDIELAAARSVALERRPEIADARLKVEQADYDRRLKKSDYIPNVSLSFNYISPLNYGTLIPANIAVAGFVVDWEPFDWGRRKHELAEKTKTVEQANLAFREAENQVIIEVNMRFRKLQESRQLLSVARIGREATQERLRVVTNRYKQEVALLKDVLQVQTALAEANSQYSQALLAFWTAKADFERALGEAEQ